MRFAFLPLLLFAVNAQAGDPAKHWAFRPVERPAVPNVKSTAWIQNPIDGFIAARHEAKGLTPAPTADARTLLRRVSFDLTGLPPTPEEIDRFLREYAAMPQAAYESVIERLLASPQYGERWGRHWLDVARYADSEGYESDHIRPYAWRYRDYVVKSFKDDKPFDRFILEQIAGDELTPYSDENLIATGFLASARLSSNEEDKARQFNDVYVDIVNATTSAFLSLTMNCAQCHTHKIDPISYKDYYRFLGFFVKGMPNNLALKDPGGWKKFNAAKPAEYDPARKLQQAIYDQAHAKLTEDTRKTFTTEQLAALDAPPGQRTPEQQKIALEADVKLQFLVAQVERAIPAEDKPLYDELKKKIAAMEKGMPDPPQTLGFYSPVTSPNAIDVLPMKGFYPPPYRPKSLAQARSFVLLGGDVHRRGEILDAGWPSLFGSTPVRVSSRRDLANWLIDPKNPLTARVWVNRIWQYHFGRGIVATSGDFGLKGSPPSHPELLDWLASELIRSGWKTKHIHRLILTSNTYRQSSRPNDANAKVDPDNLLLWHWMPRRLEVEAIRDSMLAVSGELNRDIGGAPDVAENKSVRRTIYLLHKRQKSMAILSLFDAPTAATESCFRRLISTVPLQSLYLLNNEFSLARAKALAERVRKEAGSDCDKQVERVFVLTLGRPPDDKEKAAAGEFMNAVASGDALVLFAQALMNVNEFVYVE